MLLSRKGVDRHGPLLGGHAGRQLGRKQLEGLEVSLGDGAGGLILSEKLREPGNEGAHLTDRIRAGALVGDVLLGQFRQAQAPCGCRGGTGRWTRAGTSTGATRGLTLNLERCWVQLAHDQLRDGPLNLQPCIPERPNQPPQGRVIGAHRHALAGQSRD